jgi:phage gp46-like protein
VTLDWRVLDDGTLDDTQALASGFCVALGTNALADITDELPDPDSTDRNGWWGDLDCQTIWNAWPIGSKLWLMRRSAIESPQSRQGSTITRVQNYCQAALQPFIDNKIVSNLVITSSRVDKQRIDTLIRAYRGAPVLEMLYSILWDEFIASAQLQT